MTLAGLLSKTHVCRLRLRVARGWKQVDSVQMGLQFQLLWSPRSYIRLGNCSQVRGTALVQPDASGHNPSSIQRLMCGAERMNGSLKGDDRMAEMSIGRWGDPSLSWEMYRVASIVCAGNLQSNWLVENWFWRWQSLLGYLLLYIMHCQ